MCRLQPSIQFAIRTESAIKRDRGIEFVGFDQHSRGGGSHSSHLSHARTEIDGVGARSTDRWFSPTAQGSLLTRPQTSTVKLKRNQHLRLGVRVGVLRASRCVQELYTYMYLPADSK